MPDIDDTEILGDDDDLAALRALSSRVEPIDPVWQTPPADLWDRIAAEAGVPAGAATEGPVDLDLDLAVDVARLPTPRASPTPGPAPAPPPASLDQARAQRRTGLPPWLLVAAAVLAVLAIGALAITALDTDDGSEVVATGVLEPLTDRGSGRAELVEVDGSFELRVDLDDLDAADGFHEVWMIDTEVSRLVSLGPVRGDGTYTIPAGMDPAAFPIVDVSVEPIDGDPTHSGASVLRGQLEL